MTLSDTGQAITRQTYEDIEVAQAFIKKALENRQIEVPSYLLAFAESLAGAHLDRYRLRPRHTRAAIRRSGTCSHRHRLFRSDDPNRQGKIVFRQPNVPPFRHARDRNSLRHPFLRRRVDLRIAHSHPGRRCPRLPP